MSEHHLLLYVWMSVLPEKCWFRIVSGQNPPWLQSMPGGCACSPFCITSAHWVLTEDVATCYVPSISHHQFEVVIT